MDVTRLASVPLVPPPQKEPPSGPLWEKAVALEATFLSEMLAHTGMDGGDTTQSSFSGGIGEGQFASFLRNEQANLMARQGGIGLAESLYKSLTGI